MPSSLSDFSNSISNMKVRKNQEVVQLWHGPGAFKKMGISRADKRTSKLKAFIAKYTGHRNYTKAIVDELQGLDALLLEANHDVKMLQLGTYPYPLKQRILGDRGHLSNERSGQLLSDLLHDHFGTVLLGHLSKENNYEELAYEAVRLEVTMGDTPYKAEDFPMYVAKRDTVSPMIRV